MAFRITQGDAGAFLAERRYLSLAVVVAFAGPGALLISFALYIGVVTFVDPETSPAAEQMRVVERLAAAVVMLTLSLPFLWLTRRFALGKRRMVLFLRRFRRASALATVTRAAMPTSGLFGLRIVTLSDGQNHDLAGEARFIRVESEIEPVLRSVRRMTRGLFAPQQLFIGAGETVWQAAVRQLAAESDAVVIDVSEPSPSILWELETVGAMAWPRLILVGEFERLRELAEIDLSSGSNATDDERLARLLHGQEVLAYQVGWNERAFRLALQARYDRVRRLHYVQSWAGAGAAGRTAANVISVGHQRPPPAPAGVQGDHGLPLRGVGPLASVAERLGARLVDGGVVFAVMLLLVGIEAAVRCVTGIERPEAGDAISAVLGYVLLAVVVSYDALTTRAFGATPGKRALGLRVVAQPGLDPAKTVIVGLRSVIMMLLWFCVVPGILDIAAATNDPYRRTWHDRAAATLVVRV